MSTHIRTLRDSEGNMFYPLTTSEAVVNGLIVDLSDITSGSTYSTLSTALSALPEMYRKGGMELRYINSDGEYVQYRYTGTAITGNPNPFMNTSNWTQGNVFASGESVDAISIDSKPTAGSNNLVSSGGVADELALGAVYDVSAHNSGTTFSSLSALLTNANLSTLIPTSVRKGGMSIKFVQTSDNKYVQYRLVTTSFSTIVSNWQEYLPIDKIARLVKIYPTTEQIKDNYYIDRQGNEVSNTDFCCTNFIDIKSAGTGTVIVKATVYNAISCVWYNVNYNLIGYIDNTNAASYNLTNTTVPQEITIEMPANVGYIRLCCHKSSYTQPTDIWCAINPCSDIAMVYTPKLNNKVSIIENIVGGIKYTNAVNSNNIISEKRVNESNGSLTKAANWFTTDFILLKANTVYNFNKLYYYYIAAYSVSDMTFVSGAVSVIKDANSNFKGTITVGNNDVFIRMCGQTADLATAYISDVYNTYHTYGVIKIKDEIDGEITPISTNVNELISTVGGIKYKNEINPAKVTNNRWLSNGVPVSAPNWSVTDYILLKANTTYAFDKVYYYYNACYTVENKTYISNTDAGVTLTHETGNNFKGTITTGDIDIYFRASMETAYVGVSAYISAHYASYQPYEVQPIEIPEDNSGFTKCLIIGDSISAYNYGYYDKWAQVLTKSGFLPVNTVNSSIIGTGYVCTMDGTQPSFNDRIENIENPETFDLVIVFGGVNDSGYAIGQANDDYTEYVLPAVNHFYDYLCSHFLNARILVFTPLKCDRTYNSNGESIPNRHGVYFEQLVECITNAAKKYSLPVLNLTENSGFYAWQTDFKTTWCNQGDGLHPNAAYNRNYLAPVIKQFIKLFKK